MPVHNFLAFAQGGGALIEDQGTYLADTRRINGNQPGIADPALNNKALRQATVMAVGLAQFLVDNEPSDVHDALDGPTLSGLILAAVRSATLMPAGAIIWLAGNTPPAGTVKCNGAALSRTTYARLWAYAQASGNIAASDAAWGAAGGAQFSPGDGSTYFRVPDLRGYSIRAWDDGRAIDSGRTIGSFQAGQLPSHTHTVTDPGHAHGFSMADTGHAHAVNVTDPSHAHLVADPTHTHAHNDPGHAHVLNDAGHSHTITDPGHTHAHTDPGHAHGLTDPGHVHDQPHAVNSSTSGTSLSGADHTDTSYSTALAFTGATVNAAASGVTNVAAATGIAGSNNAATGVTMNNAVTSMTNVGAATGVAIVNAFTGITAVTAAAFTGLAPGVVAAAATGITLGSTGAGTEVRVPNAALMPVMYY